METMKLIKRIPINLIAGTLGVGKTTAINHLLAQRPEGESWAVLVNEYGQVGLDAALLETEGVEIREVAGGCICCSAGFMFEVSLLLLLQRAPDRLIIEPTGLATLSGILDMLARWDLGPEAVDAAVGDTNSAGKSEAGYRVNQLLEQRIAVSVGLPPTSPPFKIRPARKGPGSVAYTARLLHSAMVRGDVRVHPNCERLIQGFRHWRGPGGNAQNKELSHILDAARYIGREYLDTRQLSEDRIRVR